MTDRIEKKKVESISSLQKHSVRLMQVSFLYLFYFKVIYQHFSFYEQLKFCAQLS